jgi:hypothetical protein
LRPKATGQFYRDRTDGTYERTKRSGLTFTGTRRLIPAKGILMTQSSPFSMFMDLSRLAFESNMVIGMRMMRLAGGDHRAMAEAQLMVTEKIQTAGMLAVENSIALATGKSFEAVGKSSIAKYRKAVRANHKRLSRTK